MSPQSIVEDIANPGNELTAMVVNVEGGKVRMSRQLSSKAGASKKCKPVTAVAAVPVIAGIGAATVVVGGKL